MEIRRRERSAAFVSGFLPFRETLDAAIEEGVSVGDYIDSRHSEPGTIQRTIDEMGRLGVSDTPIERVVEIGSGSGRYTEKTLARAHPAGYEIYETDPDWARWVASTYQVTAQPADGVSLGLTPDRSVDLVQAHKLFVYIPFLGTCRYLNEMARVVRDGGYVVFDVFTEACLDEANLSRWLATDVSWISLVPRDWLLGLLGDRGLRLVGSFFVPVVVGRCECFVFRREAAG